MLKWNLATATVGAFLAAAGLAHADYLVETQAGQYFGGNGYSNAATYNYRTGAYFNTPNGGSAQGTSDTTGTATSAYDLSSLSDADASGSSYAYSNLATATLGVMTATSGYYANSYADADFSDVLHYTVSGANAGTITDIGVTFAVDGSMSEGGPYAQAELVATMSLGEDDLQVDAGDNLSGNTCPNGPCIFAEGTNNWVSYSFTQYTPDEIVFSGVYALQGASGSLPVAAGLSLLSSETVFGSTDDDYSHTAALSFTLPQGVSYTSDSGVFLTQTQPSAVPEPSAVWLLLTGVGMVEAFRRLRPSNRWNAGAIRNRRAAR